MSSEKRTKAGIAKKNQYISEYRKKNYKRVPLDLTLEKYNEVKTASENVGESVNGYIKNAIDARLDTEKNSML